MSADRTQRFLVGQSCARDPARLVDECLEHVGELPAGLNLGFVYATDVLGADLHGIMERLKQRTGVAHWTGTLGSGICTTDTEYYDSPALVVMLAGFDADSFKTIPNQTSDLQQFIATTQHWCAEHSSHFGVIHADPTNSVMPSLLQQLSEDIPGAFLVGGLTSSSGENLQIADEVTSGGVSGVLFSEAMPVAVAHTQGCTPLGPRHAVTACERNIVIELDGRPALDVLKEDIGEVLAKDLKRIGGYIFVGLPVPGSDTADYMVRNLVGIDIEQKLIAIGDHLESGKQLMFCRRDGNSAREDMARMLTDIGKRITTVPRGALYYSCVARGRNQFGDDAEELKMISEHLGDIPLVGFFGNGEVFHSRLYGYTGVLSVFL